MFTFSASNSIELKHYFWPSRRSQVVLLFVYCYVQTVYLSKHWHRNCHTQYHHVHTDSGYLAFRFCDPLWRRQEGNLPVLRLYEEHAQNWNKIVLFIVHKDFDHAWVEHYPATLIFYWPALYISTFRILKHTVRIAVQPECSNSSPHSGLEEMSSRDLLHSACRIWNITSIW